MTEPLKGRCGKCDHVFVVAHLPMSLTLVAGLMKSAACPSCGSKEPIYVANAEKDGANV